MPNALSARFLEMVVSGNVAAKKQLEVSSHLQTNNVMSLFI